MDTFNTQQASYQFWRGPCDACAADHVINSSRPSASVFPPPHLIITRNAHGAEDGEGLGTRLDIPMMFLTGKLSQSLPQLCIASKFKGHLKRFTHNREPANEANSLVCQLIL